MCGIAGIIHRDGPSDIGTEMTQMLGSMKHRGPDSTGFALFGKPSDLVVIRFKLADANDKRDMELKERLEHRREEGGRRLKKISAPVESAESDTAYADPALSQDDGDLKLL